ncbi:MAG: DUF3847 domain-containing protein [Eubacteriales bacterium]|jgi:hypothetical protein
MSEKNNTPSSAKLEKLRDKRTKTQEKLDEAIREKEQIEHQIKQSETRQDYFKKKKRANRTHRLCIKGGAIESIVPGLTDFTEKEFYELMEMIFSLPQVQSLVEGKINNRNHGKDETSG